MEIKEYLTINQALEKLKVNHCTMRRWFHTLAKEKPDSGLTMNMNNEFQLIHESAIEIIISRSARIRNKLERENDKS